MGRRPKETFLQREHADGQLAHEKMLNIANHQKNTNHNEIYPHTCQNRKLQNNKWLREYGKRESLYTEWGCRLAQPFGRTVLEVP